MSERVPLIKAQYRYIYERSGKLSEWTRESADRVEIHHIKPVGYAVRRLGESHEVYNHPTRLILLTRDEHHQIHPDVPVALAFYSFNRRSFEIMFERRRKLTEQGKPYWVTFYDDIFERIARENTERMEIPWPVRILRKEAA